MNFKKPTFAIVLFTSKTLANQENPVMIRATFSRDRRYYSLGLSATPSRWNSTLGRYEAKRLTEEERQANHFLNEQESKLKDTAEYFEKVSFTFDRFQAKFFSTASGRVLEYFDTVIDELEAAERLGSARTYKNTRDKLKEFKKKDFTFQDVDKSFLQKFETFTGTTCSPATTGIYLRTLRALYNRAIDARLVTKDIYPFEGFTIKTVRARKKALNKSQIDILKNYKAPIGSQAWHSLNLFLFSYYSRGMNLTDMASLKWSNINNGRLYYERQKTGSPIDLLIDDNLAKILTLYPGDNFIFPILEDDLPAKTARYRIHARLKKINADLKSIATALNLKALPDPPVLPEDLTFYWARHSYATALKRAGVGISIIQETLGHSSEQVTRNYLDSFETNQLDEISKHL